MNGWDNFISENPALVVGAFTFLWVLLAASWGQIRWFVKREFRKMEAHQDRQDKEIQAMKKDMAEYKLHFAVSQRSFDGLVDSIKTHIEKEEDIPKQIGGIAQDVAWIKGRLKNGGEK